MTIQCWVSGRSIRRRCGCTGAYLQSGTDAGGSSTCPHGLLPPEAGDWILIRFRKPIHLAGYKIQSGTYENPSDLLYNTTVELEPEQPAGSRNVTGDGFLVVGDFDDLGLAEAQLDWKRMGPIKSMRLTIHSPSRHQIKVSQVKIDFERIYST